MKQLTTRQAEAVKRLLSALEVLEDPNGMLPIPNGPELDELIDAREEVSKSEVLEALR